MPLERLKRKTTIECLWIHILSLMKDKPLYAYEVREKLESQSGFKIGQVTAYMVLYKLERDGFVKAQWETIENRKRKYYTITEEGENLLKKGEKYVQLLTKKLFRQSGLN
ncbi:MAG TPA: PadR family transcriptional regulator [Candidatus Altiarchaeales archaeon]|nr:PadR family transcriptional regulator [Candidatus Altiarchaeales archaeon]